MSRSVRYGFNAQRLAGQRLGVGRYIEYLLSHWQRMLGSGERLSVFVREPLDDADFGETTSVRHLRPSLSGLLWENLVLARRLSKVDVLFGPSYTIPLSHRGRSVVAIHSVNESREAVHPWWHRHTYSRLYRRSGRRADAVVVPCHSTGDDVTARYGIPADKIEVVPQGVDPSFRPMEDEARLRATRRRLWGDDVPYVLFVGKLSRRRNIPTLMRAFASVKKELDLPHNLLLFGPNHRDLPLEELAVRLGVGEAVVQTPGEVEEHQDLVPIYNAADVFVHPSTYEGWSMTTLEAFACGIPVIAADRGGLGELANGYAYMVDSPFEERLSEALASVLRSPELRADLRERSLERGAMFTWEETARDTLEVLRAVAGQ